MTRNTDKTFTCSDAPIRPDASTGPEPCSPNFGNHFSASMTCSRLLKSKCGIRNLRRKYTPSLLLASAMSFVPLLAPSNIFCQGASDLSILPDSVLREPSLVLFWHTSGVDDVAGASVESNAMIWSKVKIFNRISVIACIYLRMRCCCVRGAQNERAALHAYTLTYRARLLARCPSIRRVGGPPSRAVTTKWSETYM